MNKYLPVVFTTLVVAYLIFAAASAVMGHDDHAIYLMLCALFFQRLEDRYAFN